MKVTDVRTLICHAYRCNWVFVIIETDAGLRGIGEATLEMRERTVATAVDELKRTLIGRDAHDIEGFWHEAYRDGYWRGGAVLMSALAGVEIALWDLKGKALGVPVYQLLGGKLRDRVPCYANGWFVPAKTPEEFADKAREAVDAGFTGLKWDPFGSAYMSLSKGELTDAIDCVAAVHEAVGDRADLLIEGHGRFDIPTAVRVAQALEPFKVLWFEEPVPPDNLDALMEVKRRSRVPIAAGERLYSRWDYRRFFEMGAGDFAQPDVTHAGGIMELKKIAAMAEACHIPLCPHNPSGPVANAATLQLAACCPNFRVLETMSSDVPWRNEICDEQIHFEAGQMGIPDKPGLGIELDENAIAQHPYAPKDLRHYRGDLTDIRPPDAAGYFTDKGTAEHDNAR